MSSRLCPFCMQMVDADICPHCGKDVNYIGSSVHLPAGYVIDGKHPYVLGAALGQGGFGITYIALDMVTNMRVAIKEYYPTFCSTRTDGTVSAYPNQEETFQKGRRRFLDEARTLKSLSDLDGIVDVLDFFEFNNSAYLVMEFLDGSSLKNYAAQNGKFPTQEFLQQIAPLMGDVHRMHQRGIIHRDIAPDNIVLLPDGRMKLIDFGAARSFVGDSSMTVVVKKGFAPVEQYVSKGSSACTDVYALAATIYYCITGKVPMEAAERQYNNTPLPLPSSLGAELTHQQEKALMHALEVQQKKRTQSVQELLEAIKPKPATPVRKKPTASETAAAKAKREAEAAAAKQKRETEAAAAKQKREAEAAAAKQKKEAASAAKEQKKAAAMEKHNTGKMLKIAIPALCAAAVMVAVPRCILPNNQYYKAVSLMQQGKYPEAMTIFQELGAFKDSSAQILACQNALDEEAYQAAVKLMKRGIFEDARKQFEALGDYKDSKE